MLLVVWELNQYVFVAPDWDCEFPPSPPVGGDWMGRFDGE
jgi:hypothetical protein